jgi:hypothetical protein
MDKVKEFQHFLEVHLDELTRSIVFNRNPISIEFYKGDFYSKMVNEFVRLNDLPQEIINPDIPKEELVEVAKQIRRYNRSRHKVSRKPKLKSL